jgi:hypothetical protein
MRTFALYWLHQKRRKQMLIKREDQPTTDPVTVDDLIKELGGGA